MGEREAVQTVQLPVSEDEIDTAAKTTQQKIKNLIFFKRDGKQLFDKLIKPLNVSAKHLIIVPDKSLWKIPFQALSADGEKYLIEEKLISYAPSVAVLLEQLKSPDRRAKLCRRSPIQIMKIGFCSTSTPKPAASRKFTIQNRCSTRQSPTSRGFRTKPTFSIFRCTRKLTASSRLDSFLGFRKIGRRRWTFDRRRTFERKTEKGKPGVSRFVRHEQRPERRRLGQPRLGDDGFGRDNGYFRAVGGERQINGNFYENFL